jgi:hypothetical protein
LDYGLVGVIIQLVFSNPGIHPFAFGSFVGSGFAFRPVRWAAINGKQPLFKPGLFVFLAADSPFDSDLFTGSLSWNLLPADSEEAFGVFI